VPRSVPRFARRLALTLLAFAAAVRADAAPCTSDAGCGPGERCHGEETCGTGVCVPELALTTFPIGVPGVSAYDAAIVSVLDHAGGFYTGCCDTQITAFTGETARREDGAFSCPAAPTFPACLFASCSCGYAHPDGLPFTVAGAYASPLGPGYLYYDGHAGWDYSYGAGVPLVAVAAGSLCKAVADPINGTNGQATAWDGFHTFYVDHGVVGGSGYASWYLHAADLAGTAVGGAPLAALAPGQCAPVVEAQLVATVGNAGTFLPHLHFELRRYVPADGAEGPASKVIDPYGWRGTTPDPWTDPLENAQALSQSAPAWIACGNGRVECGEACDDGNVAAGDCCSPTCQYEGTGTACDDTNPCTASDVCDGAGECAGVAAPAPTCRSATNGLVQLRDREPDTQDSLQWKWTKGDLTTLADLGDPVNGTTRYDFCVYDESAGVPTVAFRATVPAGGTCGTKPCWKAGTSLRYDDRAAAAGGIRKLVLRPGVQGQARIQVKGKGEVLVLPGLPLAQAPRVTVQLRSGTGACWGASYAPPARTNDGEQFKDGLP
jgi:cysteine-rich repeat protein